MTRHHAIPAAPEGISHATGYYRNTVHGWLLATPWVLPRDKLRDQDETKMLKRTETISLALTLSFLHDPTPQPHCRQLIPPLPPQCLWMK